MLASDLHRGGDIGATGGADEKTDRTVEGDIGGALVDGLSHVEGLEPKGAVVILSIEITLYHVVFTIDRWQSTDGLDEDQAIHAVGNVHRHGSSGTVQNEVPRRRPSGKLDHDNCHEFARRSCQ